MKSHRINRAGREHGVALVTTVIVVAVLAVVAAAFMQSTTVDRLSARSVGNHYRAKLAAEAAAAAAQSMVVRLIQRYPDSVTVWQNIGGVNTNEATVLYVRALSNNTSAAASPGMFGNQVAILARPLVSLTGLLTNTNIQLFPLNVLSNALPFDASADPGTMVNLNATNNVQPRAFIGIRTIASTNTNADTPVLYEAPKAAAQWVYIGEKPGPTNPNNPAVARFAFWVEDESFKLNLNIAGSGARNNNSLGLSAREARVNGALLSSSNAALRNISFDQFIAARNTAPGSNFMTLRTAAFLAGLTATNAESAELVESNGIAVDEFRFLTTVHSAGLDLSRGGFKRFNINSVTNSITASRDTNIIRTNLDRIIAAITNTNAAPLFGQRFYRLDATPTSVNATNSVTNTHPRIYLQKIAANILDYVDADNQPTIVANNASNSIIAGPPSEPIAPLGGGRDGPSSVAAIGVENVPRLQEYALHAKILAMNPIGFSSANPPSGSPSANFEFTIDHYFEFWNAGTRDIVVGNDGDTNTDDLGPTFLKVLNQPPLGANVNPPIPRGRDFEVSVPAGTRFPAGRVTVLTTAPTNGINSRFTRANIVSLEAPIAVRRYVGTTGDVASYPGTSIGSTNRFFTVALGSDVTVNSPPFRNDYETEMLLRNDVGHIESFIGLPIGKSSSGGSGNALDLAVTNITALGGSDTLFVRGGSLRGNASATSFPFSAEGDPRALNEQLEFTVYQSSGVGNANDQTRFYNTMTDGNLGNSTVGGPQAAAFVRPDRWPDLSANVADAANAPLVVRNNAMLSVGELGHLTDPARALGFGGAVYSRGGGRTLRIGQPELASWFDGRQTNASRTWASWRLADIFTTTTTLSAGTVLDSQGNLTNAAGVVRGRTNSSGVVLSIPGLINPNGLLRDNGAALRAALFGLRYEPSPAGAFQIENLTNNINTLITNIASRLSGAIAAGLPAGSINAFWERGEISQISLLNSGSALVGVNMSNVFDRGREELVRRSVEMLTTRGSVFTVYAVGEALQGSNVTGTVRLKQTFQIEPQFQFTAPGRPGGPPEYADDSFSLQAARINRRFSAPTNYTTRILQTAYE